MVRTKLYSSDMNGKFTGPTEMPGHTMSHMIAVYAGNDAFDHAFAVFKEQTDGQATMQKAFGNAAQYYRGMTLRKAIEYAIEDVNEPLNSATHIKYVPGFWDFLHGLSELNIAFLINSTGYDVTVYAVQEQAKQRLGHHNPIVSHSIGNHLLFDRTDEGYAARPARLVTLPEPELRARQEELMLLVQRYFRDPVAAQTASIFDEWRATGHIHLGLPDEKAKATLLFAYVREKYPDIKPEEVAHGGDSMGDVEGILGVARAGGKGVAFNYNKALKYALRKQKRRYHSLAPHIHLIDKKGPSSDMRNILPVLER